MNHSSDTYRMRAREMIARYGDDAATIAFERMMEEMHTQCVDKASYWMSVLHVLEELCENNRDDSPTPPLN